MITIYRITNSINDKIYVGQTCASLSIRFKDHKNPVQKGCAKLHRALNKYGRENFRIEAITEAYTQLEADVLEVHFIAKFNTVRNGYNLRSGGSHGKHSESTKIKMSLAASGKLKSEKHCLKISEAKKGLRASVETRAKMSLAKLGNKIRVGCQDSEETKKRKSMAMTGNKHLEGHRHSEESKARISKGLFKYNRGVK